MSLNIAEILQGGGLQLIASKTGINGAAIASTALDFVNNAALSTHTPLYAIVKYGSGTLGIGVVRIKTTAGYLVAVTALLTLTTTDNNFVIPLTGAITNSGSISVEVTTASAGASTFSIYIYGVLKN